MQQRDARICTAKAGFFRSGDNSPSSGHVTRRSLLCHCFAATSHPCGFGLPLIFSAGNASFPLEIHKVFLRENVFFRRKISGGMLSPKHAILPIIATV